MALFFPTCPSRLSPFVISLSLPLSISPRRVILLAGWVWFNSFVTGLLFEQALHSLLSISQPTHQPAEYLTL